MARPTFPESGSIADAIPHTPVRKRYPCFATDCPMPGTIFPQGVGDGPGTCAWHYNVNPSDIPRVTRILLDWQCLSYEVNEARRVLTGELATDPKAIAAAYDGAWARLAPLVPGWEDQLRPGNILWKRDGKLVDSGMAESYGDWAKKLERFLGGQVAGTLRTQVGRRA